MADTTQNHGPIESAAAVVRGETTRDEISAVDAHALMAFKQGRPGDVPELCKRFRVAPGAVTDSLLNHGWVEESDDGFEVTPEGHDVLSRLVLLFGPPPSRTGTVAVATVAGAMGLLAAVGGIWELAALCAFLAMWTFFPPHSSDYEARTRLKPSFVDAIRAREVTN